MITDTRYKCPPDSSNDVHVALTPVRVVMLAAPDVCEAHLIITPIAAFRSRLVTEKDRHGILVTTVLQEY